MRAAAAMFFICFSLGVHAVPSVEVMLGVPRNAVSPLTISQSGQPDISTKADFSTKPFTPPLYYAIRLANTVEGRAWELELIHHKIYLINKPDGVQKFNVSHGYNFLTVNRSWNINPLMLRVGAGAVIAHPENTVRNQPLDEHDGIFGSGQYLAGPAVQLSLGWQRPFYRHWFLSLDGKITYSYTYLKVVDGDARLFHGAIHGLAGIGYRW